MKLWNVKIPIYDKDAFFELEIENGMVVSLDRHHEKISGNHVFSFSEKLEKDGEWDAKGRIVLPGLADAHMHLDKSHSLYAVGNESGTLEEAIENYRTYSPNFTDADVKARIKKTALAALKHGTTAIRTHIDFNTKLDRAANFRGVRMVLEAKKELSELIDIQVFPMLPYFQYGEKDRTRIEEMLALGVDGIGGAPHLSEVPHETIDEIFRYAGEYDLPIDLHTDESDDPRVDTILYVAEKTMQTNYQGRVTVDHLCSLAAMEKNKAIRVIQKMKEAELMAITLPAANMYLQGRDDEGLVRRGTTRIGEIRDYGIPLAAASDNVCDPFHPFGRADLLQIAQLTGYTGHMGGREDLPELVKMITTIPKQIMGISGKGLSIGEEATFVMFDAQTLGELFAELPQTRAVFGKGRWLSRVWQEERIAVEGEYVYGECAHPLL
ncbi:amidohydrolase family protein [Salibacterium aidingense]|uniref:amidohydrolase family protein n=1 Tax=Salibacterium aidingense TaxID=384933 RepID=UPI003BC813E8